ncbi:MAG: hypothetical protein QM784_00755 [Polyangiaceae bacterium]
MTRKLIVALLMVGASSACSKNETISEGPRPTTTLVPSAINPPAPAANGADSGTNDDFNLVVPSDLDEKAKEEISATNLEKQLDELEKEIGRDE